MRKPVKYHPLFPGWQVTASGGTIGFLSLKRKAVYVLQISRKDPWKKPHIERDYLGIPESILAGWLFFYVGKLNCDPKVERRKER